MSHVSNELHSNSIQKNIIYLAPITVVVGAILASLGGYLAHRFGSLSIGGAVGIGAGGTTGTLLLAIAILSSSQNSSKRSVSSSVNKTTNEDVVPPQTRTAGKPDLPPPETTKAPSTHNPSRGISTPLSLEKQLETAEGSQRIRLRAKIAAKTLHGNRFDPEKHRIAFICKTGEDASQVAYALFRYAYPTMELLPPHGTNNGFDPKQLIHEPRCTAPNPNFLAAIGVPPVPKFGEREFHPHPSREMETMAEYLHRLEIMGLFYSGGGSKTTLYLIFGSDKLRKAVAKKIGHSPNCILCKAFDPIGNYEQIANQIIDAIANGLFWPPQAQQ